MRDVLTLDTRRVLQLIEFVNRNPSYCVSCYWSGSMDCFSLGNLLDEAVEILLFMDHHRCDSCF